MDAGNSAGSVFKGDDMITISQQQLSNIVNKLCGCGGRGPDDPDCCVVCTMYHMIMRYEDPPPKSLIKYGCHVDVENGEDIYPDCAIGAQSLNYCMLAVDYRKKEDCPHWKPIPRPT